MQPCHCCGNTYRRSFEIVMDGTSHHFDSFECAIHMLAPTCEHCGCRVLGHGIEGHQGQVYCCAHCAREAGEKGVVDNAAHAPAASGN